MAAWTDLSRAMKVVVLIASMIVTLGSATTAWVALGLPVLATRAYVDDEHVKDTVARDQIVGVVIELARDQKDRLARSRDTLVARLTAATDPQGRSDLQSLVAQANQDVMDVEFRITAMERLRGK